MAAPSHLAAQPHDILRTAASYLSIRDGARAAGAVPEIDGYTQSIRRQAQLEQWGWLFPDLKELSFSEGEERLRPFGVHTLDLSEKERAALRVALRSLEQPPPEMSEAYREKYIAHHFPLHCQWREWSANPKPETDRAMHIYDSMLLPEEAQDEYETAKLMPLRMALAEADFTTVLTTFTLDSTRFAPVDPEHPAWHSLMVAAILRNAHRKLEEPTLGERRLLGIAGLPIHDRVRNLLLVALLTFGWVCANPEQALLGPLQVDVEAKHQAEQFPALAYQALSMGGYDFLGAVDEDSSSLFVQELEEIPNLGPAPKIENKVLRMQVILDRLLVQQRLEIPVETGWSNFYIFDEGVAPEDLHHIPLEALLWFTHSLEMVGTRGYLPLYEEIFDHLIGRGVQPNRLRDKLRSMRTIERLKRK